MADQYLSQTETQLGWEVPDDKCCRLYESADFSGTAKEFCLWEGYDYFHYNLVDYGFNDMMTSYVCGKNVAARFCSHLANENCQNGDASSGGGNTRNNSIEFWRV